VVEALLYDTEGRWFDFRLTPSHRIVALCSTQRLTETSPIDISRGGEGSRCVGVTALLPSCADTLEILGDSTNWIPDDLYLISITI
jgi:hypothetical protein